MSASWPPKKNAIFTFGVGLVSQANTKLLQSNPTLAAGDVKVSTDFGTLGNLTTLPVVTPTSSDLVKVTLSAAEFNGDDVDVFFSDVAGAEWADKHIHFKTARLQLDDLDPVDINTAASAPTATTLPFASGKTANVGDVVRILSATAGAGQSRFVEAFAAGIATVDTWTITPTGTVIYAHFRVPPGSSTGVLVGNMNTGVWDAPAIAASGATKITDDVMARVLDGKRFDELIRLFGAALIGKVSGLPTAPIFRSTDDLKNRITVTSDADGNRITITLDATP